MKKRKNEKLSNQKSKNDKEKKAELEQKGYVKIEHPITRAPRTSGQRAADWLTKWAGSWAFIISFLVLLVIWMSFNVSFVIKWKLGDPFDPYPFILLNLVLSCLAAIQAPIILMSQNRENQRDRLRAQYDYAVNKKAEKEIREIRRILRRKFGG